MTKEELEIAKAAYCVGKIWDIYEGKENFDHMVGLRVKHLIELVRNYQQPSLPSNLDDAAEESARSWRKNPDGSESRELFFQPHIRGFKAGAEWREAQMKMPNSTELLSEWNDVKSILKEKDLRGDEWRLAYHAFLFGFTRGLNTKKSNE